MGTAGSGVAVGSAVGVAVGSSVAGVSVVSAVGVGAANLADPYAARDIIAALPAAMKKYGIDNLQDITGGAHNG